MLRKYVRQLKPIQENKITPVIKIQSFFAEEAKLPTEVFGGLPHEKSEKQSTTKRTVIIVRSKDRETDRDEILKNLNQAGISANLGSAQSSVDPIDGIHDGMNFRIFVKPSAGGMQETTLNASITELFPCIAYETKYNPKDVDGFHKYLMSVEVSKLNCVGSKDKHLHKKQLIRQIHHLSLKKK